MHMAELAGFLFNSSHDEDIDFLGDIATRNENFF